MICKICGRDIQPVPFGMHLKHKHRITSKEYYHKYVNTAPDAGKCKMCGKETYFFGVFRGYRPYCSLQCQGKDPDMRKKIEDTFMDHYGVKCNLSLASNREKQYATCEKKYGNRFPQKTQAVKDKAKETNRRLHNADWFVQTDEFREKSRQTCLEHSNGKYEHSGQYPEAIAKRVEKFDAVKWGELVNADLSDSEKVREIFQNNDIEAVMHFAAFSSVAESVEEPEKYFKNNYENTLNLLKVMKEFRVRKFIFSSTAALYGIPKSIPISEESELKPINPYGESKLMVENLLKGESDFGGLKYVSLRYFNAAGADLDCEIGEDHEPETHLIPLVLDAALGRRDSISIFGDDYSTPDGTCVRDYIHVNDLADAHLKALQYLEEPFNDSNIFNLGNGNGFSVKEVVDTCKKVTGIDFDVKIEGRRPGDPDILIADSKKAEEILGWKVEITELEDIVESAWNWHKKIHV